jgi:transposase
LALFISDVVDALSLEEIYRSYENADGRGQPPYHPAMMVKLLVYGYCIGVLSSRKIAKATETDIAFRVLAANQHPDHDTLAAFRQRHLKALANLFLQILKMCQKAGLVKLGNLAVDGSKVLANASKHKAMSYERMEQAEKQLEAELVALLTEAQRRDEAEDTEFGKGHRGDALPKELERREKRLQVIRAAKAELEAEAKVKAGEEARKAQEKRAEREKQEQETGTKRGGRPPQVKDPAQAKPELKAQKNFTDPESRIMKDGATKGFVQAYNAQAAVDSHAQIIVATGVTQEANDKKQLVPMLLKVEQNTGSLPQASTADTGYFSTEAITDERLKSVNLLVPPDRQKQGEVLPETTGSAPEDASIIEQMRQKLRTTAGRELYRQRKAIVEPVFGQIKAARGVRRFSFRGLARVMAEWDIICMTHNLLKLFQSAWRPAPSAVCA